MTRKRSAKGVTLRSLSQQMWGMEQKLDGRIERLDGRIDASVHGLQAAIGAVEQKLNKRIDASVHGLQATIGAVEARLINNIASMGALDRHETRAAEARLSVRLDRVEKNLASMQHLDARIADIEVVQIPQLKKAVGIR